jgi:pyruvate/2-oxoglutarate dehydrogenase complex dihydrolipoamide acyltransferase (E2) component
MSLTVTMPQLGESVTEGTIARWLKQPGDPIAKYESIAEVITDKVNAEIPAPADGVMSELIAAEGAVVPVGQPICSIDVASTGADAPAADAAPNATAAVEPSAPATPLAMSPAQTAQPPLAPAGAPAGGSAPAQAPSAPALPERAPSESEGAAASVAAAVAASLSGPQSPVGPSTGGADAGSGNGAGYHLTPAVRMLVREHGVDLGQITGSGLGGRITKKDVLEFVQQRDAGQLSARQSGVPAPATPLAMSPPQGPQPASTPAPSIAQPPPASQALAAQPSSAPFTGGEGDTVVPLTQVRKAIAEHMVRSRQTSPHAYIMVEVDMSSVSRIRDREKAAFEQRHGVKLTFLPFVARAVIEALQRHPTLNASWSDAGIVVKRSINLGIAVALEDNLIVPVVRDADRLSISGLATTMADLGARARSNHLKLDEVQGGTFTLNNTGALGAVMTQAIINQPQAAIMTMDLVVKRPVVVNDAIAIRPIMNLGLSFDHRINDGLQATRFVTAVQKLLEGIDPSGTLV